MFLGHFGAGFGAKAIAPQVSLGWLFVAAQFIAAIERGGSAETASSG